MAKQYRSIPASLKAFIEQQQIFFVATAMAEGKVNLSPKGLDSLRIIDERRVAWLNLTGSGNETAAHVQHNPRMTLMFCALQGPPMILRLYGKARAIHQGDAEWQTLYSYFTPLPGARQLFELEIELVQTSCGMGVPLFEYQGEREQLDQWAEKKGQAGIENYWRDKNQISLDGHETHILQKGGVE